MIAQSQPHGRARALRMLGTFVVALALLGALGITPRHATPAIATAEETSASADSSATTAAPLPLRMAAIGDARQLIVATCNKLGDTTGTLQFFDLQAGSWVCTVSVPCRFGKRGVIDGTKRVSGSKTTPTGLWKMPPYVFGYRKSAPAGTKMRWVRITKRSWWSSKRGPTYNAWVEAKKWPGEYLYNVVPQYEMAINTGYNARPNPSVYGRGSGIFLHIWGSGYTSGCVAISRADMTRVCQLLDPAKRPAFAVGTTVGGSKTSILAY